LEEGYRKYFGSLISNSEIKLIMKRVDADGSKYIDYSEWVVATIDK
jgi:Ca2+-binding EF-hand superfamily protein